MNLTVFHNRANVYLRLMRADKPIGTLLLLWPTLWAVWLASEGKPDFVIAFVFTLGTFLMRSAGCVANDLADRNFDAHVARTRNRPFATGEVCKKEALILIGILCFLAVLCLLPLNNLARLLSLPALFLAMTYPLTKRFFPIPQLYLGLAFSFGIPMAFAAIQNSIPVLAWLLFIANVFWTLAFDTFYAMTDKPDDIKIGIKTSAITFGQYDAEIATLCHGMASLFMLFIGLNIEATWSFWAMWMVVLYHQWQQYLATQNRDRDACFHTFLSNNTVGWLWFTGIVTHYAML